MNKYRKTIIAGNWKMNMLVSEVKHFFEELKPLMPKVKSCETVICAPFPLLPILAKAGKDAKVAPGARMFPHTIREHTLEKFQQHSFLI